ncbi:MAG: ribose-phosphate pyrophosphokinase [Bacteroidales bacterium]|nr:ribose-phosphate pyrophosphokinase [Bacteroidales bacterium]
MINDVHKHRMVLFSCEATRYFAEKVVVAMNKMKRPDEPEVTLGSLEISHFSDGEFQPSFSESVRGVTCFILQSTFPPTDNLMQLLLAIDAAKRASANKVIAVIPYFGWARQDRKDKPRVSIGAKLVANMLKTAGTDSLMVCDLHADQIQGFFDLPVNHLYASNDFLGILKKLQRQSKDRFTLAAPDMGGAKRVNAYAKYLHCPVVICHKTRARANVVERIQPIGEVEGRDIVIIDDIIDTAGTLTAAANELVKRGANSVRAFATHAVLSGPAYERIDASALTEVYVTDTIPLSDDPEKVKLQGKFRVVSLAETFARMILKVYNYEPISDEFPL